MKHKLLVVVLVLVLTLGSAWLFCPPTPGKSAAQTVADTTKSNGLIKTPDKPAAKPVVDAPVTAPAAPAPALVAPATNPASDPQVELNSALGDIITLFSTGDFVTVFNRYIPPDVMEQIPSDKKAQFEQYLASNPPSPQDLQMFIGALQTMQSQTPALNETSDQATYQVSDPSGQSTRTKPIIFKKVDGKWYLDTKSMGMRIP